MIFDESVPVGFVKNFAWTLKNHIGDKENFANRQGKEEEEEVKKMYNKNADEHCFWFLWSRNRY